ncbi:MAG: hypothetical protein J0I12_23650 [Candidatus Eremiobacteraeota bacterium]|nr:hypothetical protein [Candidatus Eremiobacteraeota bacterium]
MAAGFLDNLVTSLGGAQQGPDPNRLEGLLECARSGMSPEELQSKTRSMRARLKRALGDREASVGPMREELHPSLGAIIERNLAACAELIELLEDLSPACYEAYEQAAREFLHTSQQLAEWSSPLCPGCGSTGSEAKCPGCGVDRLIPDLEEASHDFEEGLISPEVAAVHGVYTEVMAGKADLTALTQTLQDVEFGFLEAQAVVESDPAQEPLQQQLAAALEAIDRLHAGIETRRAHELNAGWAQLFQAAVAIQALVS